MLQVLARSPSHAGAHLELSRVYQELGKREMASLMFKKAQELNPSLRFPREQAMHAPIIR